MHSAELDWVTPDAERVIARHARVSSDNPDNPDITKLLMHCMRHGHWSVLEQASASFHIVTTRAISPQLLRHRSFSFQELSQRYAEPHKLLNSYDVANFELRKQDTKNRQNSILAEGSELTEKFAEKIKDLNTQSLNLYIEMRAAGVAKECARNILLMCSPTQLHMSGTIRSFIHYVGVRSAGETQKEHRKISDQIGKTLQEVLPAVVEGVKISAQNQPGLRGWLRIN